MLEAGSWLGLALAAGHTYAISLGAASPSAYYKSTDPLSIATTPKCLQTRSPGNYSASEIRSLLIEDNTIHKTCNVSTRNETTIEDGPISIISYGLNDAYFFNISQRSMPGKAAVESPSACSKAFNSIIHTCVLSRNFLGGWVMNNATNHSSEWLINSL